LALRPGASAELAVRPENVHLAAPDGSVLNLAKVSNSTFLGSLMEYEVALADGTLLRAQTHPSLTLAVGDDVAVRLDTARATVFDVNGGAGRRREE
jgi:ABC-type sugar transport system ATPase subunit